MTIIVLEGLDGAGKSTVAKMLADATGFQLRHYPFDLERQKSRIPLSYGLDYMMMLDMVKNPPVINQDWVIDRYTPSHYAYGGRYSWNLGILPKPDYSFLIDVDPQVSYERCQLRGDDTDITLDMRQTIRGRYLELEFTRVLPGHLNPQELLDTILKITHLYSPPL